MTHIELWQIETYISPQEHAWCGYVAEVEAHLGHDLDGDQDEDGYSIDRCHDFFCDGANAEQAVCEFEALKIAANNTEYLQ